jgi:hypothetical protein
VNSRLDVEGGPVAGWRDAVSEEAQADLDELVGAAVDFALRQINAEGGFAPFALAASSAGDKQVIQPNFVADTEPDATQQLSAQWEAIDEVKSGLRAVAVAVDVRLPAAGKDAIELVVEHRESIAIGMLFPYARTPAGDYDAESPSAYSERRRVWS